MAKNTEKQAVYSAPLVLPSGDDSTKFKRFLHDYGTAVLGVLLTATVAVGIYVSQKLNEVTTRLAEVGTRADERAINLTARIDRIASALPDVRVRIAKEELAKPIQYAIIVTDSYEKSKGEVIKKVAIIDSRKNEAITLTVPAKTSSVEYVNYMVAGIAKKLDPRAVTFSELDAFAFEANEKLVSPTEISPQNSYVLRFVTLPTNSTNVQSVFANELLGPNAKFSTISVKGIVNYGDAVSRLVRDGDLHKTIEVPLNYKRMDQEPKVRR